MIFQRSDRKNQTKKIDFMQFLSGVPARDYVFQHTLYEEQIRGSGVPSETGGRSDYRRGSGALHGSRIKLQRETLPGQLRGLYREIRQGSYDRYVQRRILSFPVGWPCT